MGDEPVALVHFRLFFLQIHCCPGPKYAAHAHTRSVLFWIKKCFYGILMLSTFIRNKISSPHFYKHEFQAVKGPSRISLTKEPEAYSRFQSQHSLHSRFPAMRLGLGVENCFRFPWKCVCLFHDTSQAKHGSITGSGCMCKWRFRKAPNVRPCSISYSQI